MQQGRGNPRGWGKQTSFFAPIQQTKITSTAHTKGHIIQRLGRTKLYSSPQNGPGKMVLMAQLISYLLPISLSPLVFFERGTVHPNIPT